MARNIRRVNGSSPVGNSACACCRLAVSGRLYWVPWTDRGIAARPLCFSCLMTTWRLDTKEQMERHRQRARSEHSRQRAS